MKAKKQLILSAVLVLGQVAHAEVKVAEGQFAVLKPDYTCTVNVPVGRSSSQVYFSKDCQTAYVLPSLNMRKTVIRPYFTADLGICSRYNQVVESLAEVNGHRKKIKKMIADLQVKFSTATDEESQRLIQAKLDYFKVALKDLDIERDSALKPFSSTPAVRAQIRVESDIMDELAAFQTAELLSPINSNGDLIHPTRFAPAQISNSILAISAVDSSDLRGQSVLKIDFPATRYTPSFLEKDDYPKDAILLNMNGSMSGIVDLSAMTYCNALNKNATELSNNEEDLIKIFNSAVALNADYQVKVQAGVKVHMSSTIQAKDFLNKVKRSVLNTLYTRDVFQGALISGEVMNDLKIEIDDKGVEIDLAKVVFSDELDSNIENLNPIIPLLNKFISNHLKLVESRLKSLGLVTELTREDFEEKKAVMTTEVHHYESICSTSRNWFKKNTTCSLQPVYMQVNHDGFSRAEAEVMDQSVINNSVTFETNQTTTVRHTSTFGRN